MMYELRYLTNRITFTSNRQTIFLFSVISSAISLFQNHANFQIKFRNVKYKIQNKNKNE